MFWLTFIFFTLVAASFSVEGRFASRVKGGVGVWYGVLYAKNGVNQGRVPAFDGRGSTFLDYLRRVHLWMRAIRTELAARASKLVLQPQPAPRRVCLAEGSNKLDLGDGVTRILGNLRSYFAPEAADAIHKRVMRVTNYRRLDPPIVE